MKSTKLQSIAYNTSSSINSPSFFGVIFAYYLCLVVSVMWKTLNGLRVFVFEAGVLFLWQVTREWLINFGQRYFLDLND